MSSTAKVPPSRLAAGQTVGRFRLLRLLGRGAQATVWLGHDSRLDRDVAVKLLATEAGAVAVSEWLHEARAVSRLNHPNIVPVFEADEAAGQPYLVFEFVDGPTLTERLRERGAMPPREAVGLILGVLDALRVAHDSDIVHRDLKPSNILLDADGRARVMDFGIAARLNDRHDDRICGTPGYMSPEAASGQPPAPSMDLFAVGMVLAEMLCGQPLLRDRDPYRAIERTAREDVVLPDSMPAEVDDALRSIVRRGIARQPGDRWPSAAAFHQALAGWLQPTGADMAPGGGNATLEFLLRRMRHKADFPALSDSVRRIQQVSDSDSVSLQSLSAEIQKDVALTHKLLRVVNSAHFTVSAGPVSTVSRAVALVGFAGIRNMALSLVLLEHMSDKAHAAQLTEEFLRALLAAMMSAELTDTTRESEEAFLAALFHNLGRLLSAFYFPEEAQQIRALMQPSGRPSAQALVGEDTAALRVLGLSFEDLGCGVARAWGLPEGLQRAMRRPTVDGRGVRESERGVERMRRLGAAGSAMADVILQEPDSLPALTELAERQAPALGVAVQEFLAASGRARDKLGELANAMHIQLAPAAPARRLLAAPKVEGPGKAGGDSLSGYELQATVVEASAGAHAPTVVMEPPTAVIADVLAAGIQDITQQMAGEFKLNEVLRLVLGTMHRALAFRNVIFCLRDPRTECLTGRFGLGPQAPAISSAFQVPLRLPAGMSADLFSAVCLKGLDTLITDASTPSIQARLPAWYRTQVAAPAFLLLPLVLKGGPFALIYADKATPGALSVSERDLNQLRTLRNQAVMAFRQSG